MKRFVRIAMAGGLLFVLLAHPRTAGAQQGRVAVEAENFRAEPGGSILAELYEGAPLTLGEVRGQWRQATVEAWIWARSVRDQQAELDLLVNAEGENLRASPNGDRVGRALGGMRLQRIEGRDGWIRARRTGWIWSPSIRVDDDAAPAREAADAPSDEPVSSPSAPRPGVSGSAREFAAAAEGTVILDGPAGDTLARLRQGASVEVVAREGAWSRVRIEGWTFTGALGSESDGGAVLRGIGRDSLQARPDVYRGRVLEWSVQFIALQEAERFRTDFLEGEPFILARGPGDDAGFVYLAIPSDRVAEVQALSPLQRIRILARIRSARSPLTGAPVLELLDIISR